MMGQRSHVYKKIPSLLEIATLVHNISYRIRSILMRVVKMVYHGLSANQLAKMCTISYGGQTVVKLLHICTK